MSAVIPISVDWLTLREHADARSRSRSLARDAAALLRAPLAVHDLGSGTGAMMRWLAPRLPGPQTWVLHDWNRVLLHHAATRSVTDATGAHPTVQTRVGSLAQLRERDLAGASLVTSSALLDILSAAEVATIVRACVAAGAPALFSLSVTGHVELDPAGPHDRDVGAAFNDHQRRQTDGRRLLGPDAVAVAAGHFRAAGWSVRVAPSPWRLGPQDRDLIAEWLRGWLAAAGEERPALRGRTEDYARAASVRVIVHHEDLLAWPP